jgi:pimeloyl-ACP methyl ester carboxylesterase
MNTSQYSINLSDGRELEVFEAGDKDNPAIVFHSGTPIAPGLFSKQIEVAVSRGLRLLSYSRPGYGKSRRRRGRDVASSASDTAEIVKSLGIDRYAVIGMSGGGPHALACGAFNKSCVVGVVCIAGVAPYNADGLDFLAGMGQDNIDEFGSALQGEVSLRYYLKSQVPPLGSINPEELAEHMKSILCPADIACFDGTFGEELAKRLIDGMQLGLEGWMDDDLAFTTPWGFELSDIQVPVQVWQGSDDLMVPFSHGKWLAKNIPEAEAHLLANEGHISIFFKYMPDIYDWLRSKF